MQSEFEPPVVTVARCYECAACQEFIIAPNQAPECTRLEVRFPNEKLTCGTERKVYRAIEKWANNHFKCLNALAYVRVVWEPGTMVKPVLRRWVPPAQRPPVHPSGGFAHFGCRCAGCKPLRNNNAERSRKTANRNGSALRHRRPSART